MDQIAQLLKSPVLEDRILGLRMIGNDFSEHIQFMKTHLEEDSDNWFWVFSNSKWADVTVILTNEIGYILKSQYYIIADYSTLATMTYSMKNLKERKNIIDFSK